MSLMISCMECGRPYPSSGVPFQCPDCGGIFDWSGLFPYQSPIDNMAALWRWKHSFGLEPGMPVVSLGEGGTPLVADRWHEKEVYYKLEYLNPTGSYKDRATAVLAGFLVSRGVVEAVEDSSGNAGASFAAYAARAGIHARIYVPSSASGPKLMQIDRFHAEMIPVEGPRSAAAEAVLADARSGTVYASHAYLPFGMAGIATIAFEMCEQLGRVPGSVIAPAGHASLMLGMVRGFKAMLAVNAIDHLPAFVTVQSSACDPIRAAWEGKGLPEREQPTLAEGVKVLKPVRSSALLAELDPARDVVLACDEGQILRAHEELASRGQFVEPTSALAWAALETIGRNLSEPIVLVLTGSGLKYSGS